MTVEPATSAPAVDLADRSTHYRYPGAPPFGDNELDRRLFTGRRVESEAVLHSILSSSLFVLYAQSGLGKTSLLNAGVSEELRVRGHWPVSVRLNDVSTSPTTAIVERIVEVGRNDPAIDVVIDDDAIGGDATLWDVLSAVEVWRGNVLQHLVVILDQFEELFTLEWPEESRRRFITEFGEVVRGHRRTPADSGRSSIPPDVRFVLAIREDALGSIEELSTDVPQILRHRFRLGPLDPERAEEAIREPAGVTDDRLDSRRFEYTESAAAEILDFLRTTTVRGVTRLTPGVDPSQLQIVCQYVERAIVPRKAARAAPGEVIRIDAADLEGRAGLDRILGDFYRRAVATIPAADQQAVRRLCERGLINANGRRMSLERSAILEEFGVGPRTLTALVDARLLRGEERLDSVYYELAHDTLVPAVQADRAERAAARRRRRLIGAGVGALVAVALVSSLAVAAALRSGSDAASGAEGPTALSLGAPIEASVGAGGEQRFVVVDAPPGGVVAVTVESGSTLTVSADTEAGIASVVSAPTDPDTLYLVAPDQPDRPIDLVVSAPGAGGSFRLVATTIEPTVLGDDERLVVDLDESDGSAVFQLDTTAATAVVDVGPDADAAQGTAEAPDVDLAVEILGGDTAVASDPRRASITTAGTHVAVVRGSGSVAVSHETARPLDPQRMVTDRLADESEIAYVEVDASRVGGVLLESRDGRSPMSVTMQLSSTGSGPPATPSMLDDQRMVALLDASASSYLVRIERSRDDSSATTFVGEALPFSVGGEAVDPAAVSEPGSFAVFASPRPVEVLADGAATAASGFSLFDVDNTEGQLLELEARPNAGGDEVRIWELDDPELTNPWDQLTASDGTVNVALSGDPTARVAIVGVDEVGAPSDYDVRLSRSDALAADAGPTVRSDVERFTFQATPDEPVLLTLRSLSEAFTLGGVVESMDVPDGQSVVSSFAPPAGSSSVLVGCDGAGPQLLSLTPFPSFGVAVSDAPSEYSVELRTLANDPCRFPTGAPSGLVEPYVFNLLTLAGAPDRLANCTIEGWRLAVGADAGLRLVRDLLDAAAGGATDVERAQAALAPLRASGIACGLDDAALERVSEVFLGSL